MKKQKLIPLKDKIQVLARYYDTLEAFIKKRLFGFVRYDEKKANALKKEIKERIARQHKINQMWVGLNIPLAYNRAAGAAKERLVKIGAKVKKKRFDLVSGQSKENGARHMLEYMTAANDKIMETVNQYFRLLKKTNKKTAALQNFQLQNLVDNQEILEGTDKIIAESIVPAERVTQTGFSYLATPSRGEVQRDIKKLFQKVFGEFDFISITMKNGKVRNYKPNVYMKMLARTEMRTIQTQAVKDRCREYQNDLVQVSTHDDPCPVCKAFEGQVYSLSGNHPTYPKFEINFPIHPNCEHNINPTTAEAIAIEKEYGKTFPKPYRGSVQDRINEIRRQKLGLETAPRKPKRRAKLPTRRVPLPKFKPETGLRGTAKNEIIEKIKKLGIKNVNLTGIDDLRILREIESQLNQLVKKYGKSITELISRPNGFYALSTARGKSIGLNPKYFNDLNNFLKSLTEDFSTGFHVKGVPDGELIQSLLTHEYGHSLTQSEIYRKIGLFDDFAAVRSRYIEQIKKIAAMPEGTQRNALIEKYYISHYGNKSVDEFVAEAFTDYIHNPNPSPFSTEIGKLIDGKYKKGGVK
jgi:hypothetical protein